MNTKSLVEAFSNNARMLIKYEEEKKQHKSDNNKTIAINTEIEFANQ